MDCASCATTVFSRRTLRVGDDSPKHRLATHFPVSHVDDGQLAYGRTVWYDRGCTRARTARVALVGVYAYLRPWCCISPPLAATVTARLSGTAQPKELRPARPGDDPRLGSHLYKPLSEGSGSVVLCEPLHARVGYFCRAAAGVLAIRGDRCRNTSDPTHPSTARCTNFFILPTS
jgi:hypothetical protein